MEKKLFWLSFADPHKPKGQQFLGVVIVDAYDFMHACLTATTRGLNPGGEIEGVEIPEPQASFLPKDALNILLSKKMVKLLDRAMLKGLKDFEQKVLSSRDAEPAASQSDPVDLEDPSVHHAASTSTLQ